MSRIGKSIERENRFVVTRDWRELRGRSIVLVNLYISEVVCIACLYASVY